MPRLLASVATGESLALDFDHRNRTVCWLDRGKATLHCAPVERMEESWELPQVGQARAARINTTKFIARP